MNTSHRPVNQKQYFIYVENTLFIMLENQVRHTRHRLYSKKKQGKQNSEYNNSWIQHQLYLTDINESRWTAQWLAPSVRLLSCSEWKSTLVDLHKKGI